VAVALVTFAKDTPEQAGFHNVYKGEADHDDQSVQANMKEVFVQIVTNKYVWIMAAAYSCTGAVRQTVDQWFPRYMQDAHKLDLNSGLFLMVGFLIPFVASAGSFISGWVSDHLFGGRRAPVAACIYGLEVIVIIVASQLHGAVPIAIAFVTVAFTVNSTHSLLGPAAAMDIGGRKAAAFASGCINSFQYIGAGLAMQLLGRLLDRTGYTYFFYFMIPWAVIGGLLMLSMASRRNLKQTGDYIPPFTVFYLSILTFGVFQLAWFIQTKAKLNRSGANLPPTWMVLIPVVNLSWLWRFAQAVSATTNGVHSAAGTFLLLTFLGPLGTAITHQRLHRFGQPAT
jgi:OPA family glycerol-3-phosphate transporter-like MFS transporter